jgi:acyl-CoA thioester hydrolase
LFEEARWEWVTTHGYGIKEIVELQKGPTVLEVNVKFLKELKLRDQIIIDTQMLSYKKKIGILQQSIRRDDELCCTAEFVIGLFDLKARQLIEPTPEWLKAIGLGESLRIE